jgi:hypothetical protein
VTKQAKPLVLAAILGVALVGCGTTVPTASTATGLGAAPNGDGLSAPSNGSPASGAPLGSSNTPLGSTTGSTSGGAPGGGNTTSNGSTSAGGTGTTAVGGPARGVAATSVTVGVVYIANAGAANAALGGKGLTTGNETADAKAVIAEANRAGGLGGRKIVPLFYERDAQSTATVASQAQAECAFFTQDHKVFAVLVGNGPVDWAEKPCLNDAGVPAITSHITSLDDDRGRTGINVDVAGMSEQNLAAAQVAAIARENWLSGWDAATGAPAKTSAKVGVLSYDLPAVNHAVDDVLLPGLAKLGAKVAPQDVFRIAIPQSSGDNGAAAAAIQSSVLRLRNDGVDHLVLVDNGGAMTLLFSNDAYSQHYFPRYAGTSSNGFQALLSAGDIQAATLAGAVGAGWEPLLDLPKSTSTQFLSAAGRRCRALMAKAGLSFADVNSEAVAFGYCDKVGVLAAAIGKQSPSLAHFVGGLNALSTFDPARGVASRFSATRHDGGSGYFTMTFRSDCTCFAYGGTRQST